MLQLHAGYRFPAGEDTVVANEADALIAGGHEVRPFVVSNPTSFGDAVKALALSVHNPHTAKSVTAAIEEFRPDVIHIHNTWFALSSSVVAAAARSGVPVVMTIHNYRLGCLGADLFRGSSVCTACVGRLPLRGVIHGCYRDSRILSAIAATEVSVTRKRGVLNDHVTRFVAPSAFMRDRLIDIGLPAERLVVKPHFVADPGPRPAPPSASKTVLFVGRLAPGKGLTTLLRAWERLGSDFELSIIGDGPLETELREMAPRSVRFEGWLSRDEVTEQLLTARAFVFPSSWYEPFGMVLVEALSAGVAIIATNASEAAAITATPPSFTVPIEDVDGLATAIASLADDELVDTVGRANRLRFESHYTPTVGLRLLEQLYADVINESAPT
jgi:glycosyltransferase involved in cell wall biosynthesis